MIDIDSLSPNSTLYEWIVHMQQRRRCSHASWFIASSHFYKSLILAPAPIDHPHHTIPVRRVGRPCPVGSCARGTTGNDAPSTAPLLRATSSVSRTENRQRHQLSTASRKMTRPTRSRKSRMLSRPLFTFGRVMCPRCVSDVVPYCQQVCSLGSVMFQHSLLFVTLFLRLRAKWEILSTLYASFSMAFESWCTFRVDAGSILYAALCICQLGAKGCDVIR